MVFSQKNFLSLVITILKLGEIVNTYLLENTFHTDPSFYGWRKIEKSEKNMIEEKMVSDKSLPPSLSSSLECILGGGEQKL